MLIEEKLDFIERVLHAPKYSLEEDTLLNNVEGWESLNIVNLQMELAVHNINVEFDELMKCSTVGELCLMID